MPIGSPGPTVLIAKGKKISGIKKDKISNKILLCTLEVQKKKKKKKKNNSSKLRKQTNIYAGTLKRYRYKENTFKKKKKKMRLVNKGTKGKEFIKFCFRKLRVISLSRGNHSFPFTSSDRLSSSFFCSSPIFFFFLIVFNYSKLIYHWPATKGTVRGTNWVKGLFLFLFFFSSILLLNMTNT